jgi:large subunit ribosomal protein L25
MEAMLEAISRSTTGKNEARRLRAGGRIPAVVYGAQKAGDQVAAEPIAVDPRPLMRILHSPSGLNTLITLKGAGGGARVLVRDVQLDPVTHRPLHADFYRGNMDRPITLTVPILLRGEARGVKTEGGVLEFVHRDIEVSCLPSEIPHGIEVDVSNLGIGEAVHVRDLPTSAAWTPVTEKDVMLVHVIMVKVVEEVAPAAAVAEGAAPAEGATPAAPAEPEVIKKGKVEKEGEAKVEEKKKS